jgi:NADH-quinone oxidoreductase subunit M
MILLALIVLLVIGGFAAWASELINPDLPRWLALVTLAVETLLLLIQFNSNAPLVFLADGTVMTWLADFRLQWLPRFGIGFHLALDGLSLLLIALTVLLGFMAINASWTEIKRRQGFFYFTLLFCLAGTVGVFLALDLFLFFLFWEVMIVPMYLLINIWGHENRVYAATKFFIFTQVSSLLMLAAIVGLGLKYRDFTGEYNFDYIDLLHLPLDPKIALWLMLGFFIAFTVKLPVVPFHTWLPDAHTQAPTGGSLILAGVMLKTGAYGLIRFVVPLFAEAAHQFTPIAMAMGTVSLLYGAVMAFAQSDLKRLIAYTSVSHMGFILLGVFAGNIQSLQGSVLTMLAHGLSASALFMIAGALQERLHTREMSKMGGLWLILPRLSLLTLFFALASLGLPGLGNFIGEFLVLLGTFKTNASLTVLATLVMILAPLYSLTILHKALFGVPVPSLKLPDFGIREMAFMGMLVLGTVWLGLHPQPVLDLAATPLLKQLPSGR